MLTKKQIIVLQEELHISNEELERLGLVKKELKLIGGRVSQEEFDSFTRLSFEKNTKKIELFKMFLLEQVYQDKFNLEQIKYFLKQQEKAEKSIMIPFRMEEEEVDKIRQISNENYISISTFIRCCIVGILRLERKKRE